MKLFRFVFMISLLFPAAMAINSYRFGYGFENAFWRTLMTPFEGTVWAPGFKESTFSKISVGMPSLEVFRLLGDPIRKDCDHTGCLWIYTWQNTGTADFDKRWLDIDLAGRVKEVKKSFFID
jgi:hypothetical protein